MTTQTIYLVTCGEWEDYRVEKIFETRELAEQFVKRNSDWFRIEEKVMYTKDFDLDFINYISIRIDYINGEIKWEVQFDETDNTDCKWLNDFYIYTSRNSFWTGTRFIIEDENDKRINKIKLYLKGVIERNIEVFNGGKLNEEELKKERVKGSEFIKSLLQ